MSLRTDALAHDLLSEGQEIQTLVDKMMKVDFASSACSASAGTDKAFVISAANILQTLVCLSNLIRAAADDSGKVRVYAKLAEEKLQVLGELMRPMLWNPA